MEKMNLDMLVIVLLITWVVWTAFRMWVHPQ